ncbi:hypothetical protein N7449_005065 [Penicillium cf. viridicatum]|uniref:Zn(2)-C6 fungal-type domain-containing protein n=1 Tax=Penicillium cf. viridicatum TaxID=2972119 RepID=A0A9W9SYW9_9EURO|nr:hypothetical protein N7449_005065 [Penicillium cf. viridicatum]
MTPLRGQPPFTPKPDPMFSPRIRSKNFKTRASHPKSRNGCYTCKTRHVKCDEVRPICGSCSLRGANCSFPNDSGHVPHRQMPKQNIPVEERDESARLSESSQGNRWEDVSLPCLTGENFHSCTPFPLLALEFSAVASQPTQHPQRLNMTDLRLVQHFILNVSPQMTLDPLKSLVWQRVIPDIASDNEFLMHLMLALAGLDMLSIDRSAEQSGSGRLKKHNIRRRLSNSTSTPQTFPGSEHSTPVSASADRGLSDSIGCVNLQMVLDHHQQGLRGFREKLSELSFSNAEAIFTGSLLLVVFAFGSLRLRDLDEPGTNTASPEPLTRLNNPRVDWIHLVRGVTSIVKEHWDLLRMGRLRQMFLFNNARDSWKEYPSNYISASVPPRCWCSARLSKFALGAQEAASNLRKFSNALELPDPLQALGTEPIGPAMPITPESILSAQKRAIEILDEMFIRIMYVLQFSRSPHPRSERVDVQADIEDALVMAWPQMIPHEFILILELEEESLRELKALSLTILAHFYLITSLLEDIWYSNVGFEREIEKIHESVKMLSKGQLVSLMEWPTEVIT